jgi:hypothetical protein
LKGGRNRIRVAIAGRIGFDRAGRLEIGDLEIGKAVSLPWLLEAENPSACYLALTALLDRSPDDGDVDSARAAIPAAEPTRSILDAQYAGSDAKNGLSGYWIKPDVGYSPKYRATMWQVIFLAQLGAPPIEPIHRACEYVLNKSRWLSGGSHSGPGGRFVAGRRARTAINCLNGNLLWALGHLGYADDPRVMEAREATARAIITRGFACHYNHELPCAWGDVKVLRAFLTVPSGERSREVSQVIEQGVELLLSVPLLEAAYPSSHRVSDRWFKLGFPLAYHADILEVMTALAQAGEGTHTNVQAGIQWLLSKQDPTGRWALEQVPGKMWASFGRVGLPNKWVTVRALQLLKMAG